jgi:hypothetical protein
LFQLLSAKVVLQCVFPWRAFSELSWRHCKQMFWLREWVWQVTRMRIQRLWRHVATIFTWLVFTNGWSAAHTARCVIRCVGFDILPLTHFTGLGRRPTPCASKQ